MIVYLDSSTILRRLLNQPGRLSEWGRWEEASTSEITRVECLRKADRLRLQGSFNDKELAAFVQEIEEVIRRLSEIAIGRAVLHRAAQSYPTVVGTLDAIHLASASLWRDRNQKEIVFLTHDAQQGLAARAIGIRSLGFEEEGTVIS